MNATTPRRGAAAGLAALALLAGGCARGGPALETPPPQRQALQRGVALRTVASVARLEAGQAVAVHCVAQRDGAAADDVPTRVDAPAAAHPVRRTSLETLFVPTQAGPYTFRCDAGAQGSDRVGTTVEVVPGPAAAVRLHGGGSVVAGEPRAAACEVVDAFGNVRPEDAGQAELVADAAVRPVGGGEVRAERAGTYALGCRAGALPASGGALSVVAAPVAGVRAVVEVAGAAGPPVAGQRLVVRCRVEDAFGNPHPDVPTHFTVDAPVHPRDGAAPLFERDADGLTPRAAGTYEVQCHAGPRAGAVARVPVRAGLPAAWAGAWEGPGVVAAPGEHACYAQAALYRPHYSATDRFGNVVDDVPLRIEAEPRGGWEATPVGIVFTREGHYTVRARPATVAEGASLPPIVATLQVDSTPPQVTVSSPARGAMLAQGSFVASPVILEGDVTDPSGIQQLTVAGRPVPLPEPGSTHVHFRVTRPSDWGLNTFEIWSVDRCGSAGVHVQSYLRSPAYGPPAMAPAADAVVPQGLVARLGQPLFDDGARARPDDVAGLLERALDSAQLSAALPHLLAAAGPGGRTDDAGALPTVTHWCFGKNVTHHTSGFELVRDGVVQIGRPQVLALQAQDGGWELSVHLGDVDVPVALHTYVDFGCAGVKHESTPAAMRAHDVRLLLRAQAATVDGRPSLEVCEGCMQTLFADGEPRLEVDWQRARTLGMQPLLQRMLGATTERFRGIIRSTLQEQLRRNVIVSLRHFVDSWQLQQTLRPPPPFGGGSAVLSALDHIDFAGSGATAFGDFGLGLQFVPLGHGLATPARGPIRSAPAAPQVALPNGATVAMGLRDDALNALAWSLWASGGLDVPDLPAALAALTTSGRGAAPPRQGIEQLSVRATLPPVLMPSAHPNRVLFGLGDLYVRASVDVERLTGVAAGPDAAPQRVELGLYVSALIDAALGVDAQQRLVVTPGDTLDIRVHVADTSSPALQHTGSIMVEYWLNKSLPLLLRAALTPLPLPRLQLGGIAGVPDDTHWELGDAALQRGSHAHSTQVSGHMQLPDGAARP